MTQRPFAPQAVIDCSRNHVNTATLDPYSCQIPNQQSGSPSPCASAQHYPLCLTHPIPPRRYYTLSAEASFYPMPNARPCYPYCPTGQVQPDEVTSAMCAACKRVDIDLHLPACRRRTSQQGLEASRRRGSKASKRRPGPAARIMPPRASRLKTSLAAPSEQTGPLTAPPSGPLD